MSADGQAAAGTVTGDGERWKIAHVLLTTRLAGSERYAIELANAQSRRHDLTLILPAAAAEPRPDALVQHVEPGVRLLLLPQWRPFLAGAARRALARLRPDIAHAHLSAACKSLHRLRTGTLRVATLHIDYKPQQHAALDALVAIAPWQLAHVPQPLRQHCVHIDNWSHARPASPDARQGMRRAWGLADDDLVIGTLGRTELSKGQDLLIDAFVRAALPHARLVIVGQGRDWDALRRRAPASVVMPGFSDAPQDCLAAFDLFVSAARSEPFGLVFLEAMHARLPILATASEGARHLAAQIGTPLVPVEDVDALATALRRWHEAPAPRRNYDMSPFDLQQRLADFDAFYRRERAARLTRLPDARPPPPPAPG